MLTQLERGASHAAIREYAHVLGAAEIWLSRLQQRDARGAVWPEVPLEDVRLLQRQLAHDYREYLSSLDSEHLSDHVFYKNSAGQEFTNTIGDILIHVMMHGQYHRGKVNLLQVQGGNDPAPADYIAFLRGIPAATTRMSDQRPTNTE